MADDLELALRIRALVQGARDVAALAKETERLHRQGRQRVPDNTSLFRRGLNATRRTLTQTQFSVGKLRGLVVSLGAAFALRAIVRAADTYTQLHGQLSLVIDSSEELARVERELFASAQRTRSGYEATVGLFARLARSTRELNATNDDLLALTETINQFIIVSGADPAAAGNALFQLGQAFAGGVLRAEEFNSVIEQTPRLAEAIADGMGVTIGELRKLVNEGQVTSEAIFRALTSQREVAEREFAKMPRTVGQALQQLRNDLQRTFSDTDMTPLIEAIDEFRAIITDPEMVAAARDLASALIGGLGGAAKVIAGLNFLLRGSNNEFVKLDDQVRAIDREIEGLEGKLGRRTPGPDALVPFEFFFAGEEKINERLEELNRERERILAARDRIGFDRPAPGSRPAPAAGRPTGTGDDAKAVERSREALQKLNDELRQHVETFGQADAAGIAYRLTVGDLAADVARLGPEGAKLRDSIIEQAQALDGLVAQKKADAQAEESRQALLDEGAALTDRARTAQEVYNSELQRYGFLLAEGAISTQTFNRSVADARDRMEEMKKKANETNDEMDQFAIQAARNIQSHFADFLFDPFEDGLDGMLQGFVDVIRRMVAEAAAAQLAKALFGDLLTGGSGEGSAVGAFLAGLFHGGGEVGRSGPRRAVSPLAFVGAPRLHAGTFGLRSDEVPAILQKGEGVISREDMRAGMNVRFVVENTGTPIAASDAQVSFDTEGLVARVFTKDVQRGGPMSGLLARTFNLRRRG